MFSEITLFVGKRMDGTEINKYRKKEYECCVQLRLQLRLCITKIKAIVFEL